MLSAIEAVYGPLSHGYTRGARAAAEGGVFDVQVWPPDEHHDTRLAFSQASAPL